MGGRITESGLARQGAAQGCKLGARKSRGVRLGIIKTRGSTFLGQTLQIWNWENEAKTLRIHNTGLKDPKHFCALHGGMDYK